LARNVFQILEKITEREINKWTENEVEMPHDWAEIIAKRAASYE